MQLILASTSRYRAELLARLGLPFETAAPGIDESPLPTETPRALVTRLAEAKAAAVASHHANALIIGSDQVAVVGAAVLGKPGSADRAKAQLKVLAGREVQFLTGLCVINTATESTTGRVVETTVRLRPLTDAQIAAYVEREQPVDCAGAFKSEGLGIALFEWQRGDDPNALVGLPLIELCSLLEAEGLAVLGNA